MGKEGTNGGVKDAGSLVGGDARAVPPSAQANPSVGGHPLTLRLAMKPVDSTPLGHGIWHRDRQITPFGAKWALSRPPLDRMLQEHGVEAAGAIVRQTERGADPGLTGGLLRGPNQVVLEWALLLAMSYVTQNTPFLLTLVWVEFSVLYN